MTNTTKFAKLMIAGHLASALACTMYCIGFIGRFDPVLIAGVCLVMSLLGFIQIAAISALRSYVLPKYFGQTGRAVAPLLLIVIFGNILVVISTIVILSYAYSMEKDNEIRNK